MDNQTLLAWNDISSGFRQASLWWGLGWNDLRTRYRRTVLGPLWLTLGMAITVAGLGVVWSNIFNLKLNEFLPYLAAGLIVWQFIVGALSEGSHTFTSHSAIITGHKMPLTIHALRISTRHLINFLHNLIVYIAVAFIFGVKFSAWSFTFIPGIVFILLNYIWFCLFMGILGTRYRDIPALMGPLIFLLFLVTPVMWKPEMLGRSQALAELNPLTHFLEIVRNPLLGMAPDLTSYCTVASVTILGWIVTFILFRKLRNRIVFWL